MPGRQRDRGDRGDRGDREDGGPASFRDHAAERGEPQPIRPGIPDSLDLAAQHGVLVAKDEQFSVLGGVMAHGHRQRTEKTRGGPVDNRENHASIMIDRQRAHGVFGPTRQIL